LLVDVETDVDLELESGQFGDVQIVGFRRPEQVAEGVCQSGEV